MKVYIIGSLRNPEIPKIAAQLRAGLLGWEIFDDWFAGGPHADDCWRDYEKAKGHSFLEGLQGHAARHVFEFDKHHLDTSDAVVLIAPAGKSGHLELGYSLGKGKPGFILLDNPDRWDVMYQFATGVVDNVSDLIAKLKNYV